MIFTDRAGHMVNESPAYIGPRTDFAYLFDLKLRNFVTACLHNNPLSAPGEAGLAVQKILYGVYRAAAAGKEVADQVGRGTRNPKPKTRIPNQTRMCASIRRGGSK